MGISSDASSGFKPVAGMHLADKLGEKHRQNDGAEVRASGISQYNPAFCAARHIGFPSETGETVSTCGAAAAGRVLSRSTRRHECQ